MANSEYNLSVVNGSNLTLSLSGPTGPTGPAVTVDATITDGSANAVAGNAVFDALALKAPLANPTFTDQLVINTLVGVDKKSLTINNTSVGENVESYGIQINKSGANSFGLQVTTQSTNAVGVVSYATGGDAIGIASVTSGSGAKGVQINVEGDDCEGLVISANDEFAEGIDVIAYGAEAVGAVITSNTGIYHARFGNTGIDQSFVARVKGAFGWIRGGETGRIQAADTLTADRTYTLPDDTGTVALINPSSGTQTFTGSQIFSSRPTSSGSGTPAPTSLITLTDLIGRGGRRLSAQLVADEAGNDNTTTLKTSATLTLALEVGLYHIESLIIVSAGTLFATVGTRQKLAFTGTGTFSGTQTYSAQNGSATSTTYPNSRGADAVDAEQLFSANSSATLRYGTLNVTVAGNLVVQWAQRTAGVGSSPTLNAPSYIRVQRIS
jgi:hypothetical protein